MLPREIQAEHWPDRNTYDLPGRPIGKVRYFGLLLVGFAVLFAWMPGRQVAHTLSRALSGSATPGDWIFGGFTSLFVIAALVPFSLGLFILCGRTRVVITREQLKLTEIAGPVRRSRRIPIRQIERLEVMAPKQVPGSPSVTASPLAKLGALGAKLRDGKTKLLLLGYPGDWLQPLASELSDFMEQAGNTVGVETIEKTLTEPLVPAEETTQQPASSNARLTETFGGVEIEFPSRGFWKQSAGLVAFGIFWCGILTVITLGLATAHGRHPHGSGAWAPAAFLLFFWCIGAGLLLIGIHLGTQRWRLKADAGRLEAKMLSAIRSREWQWSAADLQSVAVGFSSVEVNHRKLEQLQVVPRAGKKTGLLTGRDHDELSWAATRVRAALGMPGPDKVPSLLQQS